MNMHSTSKPTLRDAERLVGLPFVDGEFDCGHMVVLAQRELFGREVDLPLPHPRGRRGQAALIGRLSATLVDLVDVPEAGDVALYSQADADGGVHWHLGTVFVLCGERWLLHVQVGCTSVLQPEADAMRLGLHLQGYYRWREICVEAGQHE